MIPRAVAYGCVLVLSAALAGCVASGPEIVAKPSGRIDFADFSIAPPQGSGWQMLRDDNGVMFRKTTGSGTHAYVASASRRTGFATVAAGFPDYATDPAAFAALVKALGEPDDLAGTGAPSLVEHEVVADMRFGHCAREYTRKEDRRVSAEAGVATEKEWSYSCLRPNSPAVIVRISFTERGLPGEADPSAAALREAYFDGFHFTATAAVATAGSVVEQAAIVFVVKESLRGAVRTAAKRYKPPLDFGVATDVGAAAGGRVVQLTFGTTVDSSGQKRNQGGAVVGGLGTMVLGAITPWPCTATHTLSALISDHDGGELRTYHVAQTETLVGTMLACPDPKEPGKSAAAQLVDELLLKMAADGFLTQPPRTEK